jgi:hypothetical protein
MNAYEIVIEKIFELLLLSGRYCDSEDKLVISPSQSITILPGYMVLIRASECL